MTEVFKMQQKNKNYMTILFDVKGSRSYPDKNIIRVNLKKICILLNNKYKKWLVVDFRLKDGDSVIGVTKSFRLGFMVYRDVRRLAWNYEFNLYYGLGFGTLDTGDVLDTDEINGSSVINAFTAVDYAKKDELQINNHVRFYAYDDSDTIPYRSLNTLVYLIYTEFNGKTAKQLELTKIMEISPDLTYEEIGRRMGYENDPKVHVSKMLNRVNYNLNLKLQEDIIDLLWKLQKIIRRRSNA